MTFPSQTLQDLIAYARSHEELLALRGWEAAEGALLPPEFIANYLDNPGFHPDWIGVWAVDGQTVVGSGGFRRSPMDGMVEIGYGVAPSCEGRGVASIICATLVHHAFTHGAEKVIAHTLPTGYASQRVLAKNGFTFVDEHMDPEDGLVWRYERVR